MADEEGSVFNEDFDSEEDIDETSDDNSEDTSSSNADKTEESEDESESTQKDKSEEESTDKKEEEDKTEKGTKLDPDPLSRANQELANERAKIRKYEEVLQDPKALRDYVAQFDKEEKTEKVEDQEPEIRIQDVKSTEDLQKFLSQRENKVNQKLKELDDTIAEVKGSQNKSTVASQIQSDIVTVRETYPELNPKNSSYNKELDLAVGELYEKFDLDPETKSFRGKVSLKEVADIVMRAHGSSKKQGSEEAQTTVRDKRTGKPVSGSSKAAPDETNLSASQVIAQRMAQARKGR